MLPVIGWIPRARVCRRRERISTGCWPLTRMTRRFSPCWPLCASCRRTRTQRQSRCYNLHSLVPCPKPIPFPGPSPSHTSRCPIPQAFTPASPSTLSESISATPLPSPDTVVLSPAFGFPCPSPHTSPLTPLFKTSSDCPFLPTNLKTVTFASATPLRDSLPPHQNSKPQTLKPKP